MTHGCAVVSWLQAAPTQPRGKVGRRLPIPPLGDIAISLQRARAQARRYGHPTEDEIRILMLHGLLHLLGMDHEPTAAGWRAPKSGGARGCACRKG